MPIKSAIESASDAVSEHGLIVLGSVADNEGSLVLVGSAGSSIWPAFTQSREYLDGKADPMDRWSKRVGDQVAARLGAQALYPFGENPPLPFLRWAEAAGVSARSRLGMFIHKEFGLWHAYRFALRFGQAETPSQARFDLAQECVDCETVACLSACPVDAFSPEGLAVDTCREYLSTDLACGCMERGCLARRACPEAVAFTYQPAHARFHMEAFLGA